jgi:hypothetical protein
VPASSGQEDEEADAAVRISAAYNASIYLMVGVPYLLLGGLVFFVMRGLKKNQEYLRAQGRPAPPDDLPPSKT